MNGNELLEQKYNDKIEYVINKNLDIKCLRGYVNHINRRRSCTSVYSYLNNVVKFIRNTNKPIEELKYDDYTNYLSSLIDKTSSYQITIYASLKKFSEYLLIAGYSEKDLMKDVEMPRMKEGIQTKEKRKNGYLTKEEIEKYVNNVKNCAAKTAKGSSFRENNAERDLALIILLLNTGMRCSALWKLNVSSINFEENIITTVDKEESVEEHYISDYTASVLKNWINKRRIILNGENEEALFVTRNKTRMSKETISQIVNKYAFNINGKHITPHKLRATYGTQIYESTHDLYMVQQCMGHASPKTSEKYIRGQLNTGRKMASEIMTNIIL